MQGRWWKAPAPSAALGGAREVRLIGVPPAGSLTLLLVSWSRLGQPQTEARIL